MSCCCGYVPVAKLVWLVILILIFVVYYFGALLWIFTWWLSCFRCLGLFGERLLVGLL